MLMNAQNKLNEATEENMKLKEKLVQMDEEYKKDLNNQLQMQKQCLEAHVSQQINFAQ